MKGMDLKTCKSLAVARSERYGDMKEVRAMVQESEKSKETCQPKPQYENQCDEILTRSGIPQQSSLYSHYGPSRQSPDLYSGQIGRCPRQGDRRPIQGGEDVAQEQWQW